MRLLFLLALSVWAGTAHAQTFGKYVGTVQTEWLDTDTRRMRLLAPFTYVDPKGVTWTAPAGSVIDGASIPVFAWSVIGGPFNGRYRDASVIHDVACDQKVYPWETVHEAFYNAMMASGVEPWRAKVMYAAVFHFGPRWPRTVTVTVPENEAGSAEQKALSRAEPGSGATIVRVRPAAAAPPPAPDGVSPGPRRARVDLQRVDVQIQPPPKTLSEQDFENLKEKIIQAEGGAEPPKRSIRNRSFSAPGPSGGGPEEDQSPGGQQRGGGAAVTGAQPGISLSAIRGFKGN